MRWGQTDTCVVSCRQFEADVLSVFSFGDNIHHARELSIIL